MFEWPFPGLECYEILKSLLPHDRNMILEFCIIEKLCNFVRAILAHVNSVFGLLDDSNNKLRFFRSIETEWNTLIALHVYTY